MRAEALYQRHPINCPTGPFDRLLCKVTQSFLVACYHWIQVGRFSYKTYSGRKIQHWDQHLLPTVQEFLIFWTWAKNAFAVQSIWVRVSILSYSIFHAVPLISGPTGPWVSETWPFWTINMYMCTGLWLKQGTNYSLIVPSQFQMCTIITLLKMIEFAKTLGNTILQITYRLLSPFCRNSKYGTLLAKLRADVCGGLSATQSNVRAVALCRHNPSNYLTALLDGFFVQWHIW